MEYVPPEILREVLSFNRYPVHRAVSRGFNEAESELEPQRAQRINHEYPNLADLVINHRWNDIRFVLLHPHRFDITTEFLQRSADTATLHDLPDILKLALSLGPLNYDAIASIAVTSDNLDVLKMMVEDYGVRDLTSLAEQASDKDIFFYLIDKGVDIDRVIYYHMISDEREAEMAAIWYTEYLVQDGHIKNARAFVRSLPEDLIENMHPMDLEHLEEMVGHVFA